jgi:hypothetical protein
MALAAAMEGELEDLPIIVGRSDEAMLQKLVGQAID